MNIISRIRRIEAALPKPVMGAILLREPAADAPADIRQCFDEELAVAINSGQQIVVQTSCTSPSKRIVGVIYEADPFNALLTKMALSPATDGRSKDQLSQALSEISASGNTLPVVRGVHHGEI